MHRLFPWEQPKNEHDVWRGEERSVRGVHAEEHTRQAAGSRQQAEGSEAVRRQAGALA